MKNSSIFLYISFLFFAVQSAEGQIERLKYLTDNVIEGKVYSIFKAVAQDSGTFYDKNGFYIKIVPPVFKTVHDTVILQPALNADLDTSNYFIETEVIQISEAAAEWKTATVSPHCFTDKNKPFLSLCLQKKSPDYQIVNRKFYPYREILDISSAENIIPAQTEIIGKRVLVQKARLETYSLNEKPNLQAGEKLLEVPAGNWHLWKEASCGTGDFLDPKIGEIQLSLRNKGYKVELSNVLDKQTLRAVYEFQADNNMDTEGLTDETVRMLGVVRERLIIVD